MDIYIASKFDTYILFTCLGLFMFINIMITAEIQKRKNNLKYKILSLTAVIGFFLIIFTAQIHELSYPFNACIYLAGIVILSKDILSYRLKMKHSNEKSQAIKIKSNWNAFIVMYITITLLNKVHNPHFEAVEIYFIIVLLLDIPLAKSINHYLNLYESGIAISTFSFPQKLIPYDEIIPYENVKSIEFFEYQDIKYILKIIIENLNKETPYEYIVNSTEKEEFLLFVKNYIDENKINLK